MGGQKLAHCEITISVLFMFVVPEAVLGGRGKLTAGQASPCSIGSHNELGSWHGPQEGPLHSES